MSDVVLSPAELVKAGENAEALSWALAPAGDGRQREKIRRALMDAYVAGARRDARPRP